MVFNWIDLLFIFATGSLAGWLVEILHRKNLKKLTSGFLNGPYLPVYGLGLVLVYLISIIEMHIVLRIILFTVSTTLLELITGLIFVRYFKIKLYDYSSEWLNFKGIICPLYSFYFVIMSLLFYFFAFPWIQTALNFVEGNHIAYFVLGVFYTIFVIDIIISFRVASKVKHAIVGINKGAVINYDYFKDSVVEYLKRNGETNPILRFMFTINNLVSEEIKNQINRLLKKKGPHH